jgi:putative membrane protein
LITAGLVLAVLAALLHVYIFVMESLTWTSPRTRATFGTTPETAETTKELAFNQGFYNLFLAIVTAIGVAAVLIGAKALGVAWCSGAVDAPRRGAPPVVTGQARAAITRERCR